ncbi:MAG TPA: preprotein translocase subunit SecG [Burkholderiaceae bacterium]|jgi:preprotein translocase subunit SecG
MIVNLVMLIQVVSALVIVGLVLMQHGKGADMGAAFGSGASGSLFGASGSSNFLSKSTGVAAAIFFASTLALAYLGSAQRTVSGGALDALPVTAPATGPASAPATVPAASASAPAPSVATPPAAAPAATAPASTPAAAKPASSQK